MNRILYQAEGVFESKGSKFLSFIVPFAEFNNLCISLRKTHTKAVHFVSASRYFNEYQQLIESFDDDREPKGSGGMPSLNVLRGEDIVDIGVVIVRYFGGKLLGVGGLSRAYKIATQEAIKSAKNQGFIQPFVLVENVVFDLPYSVLSQCEYEANKLGLILYKNEFLSSSVRVRIEGEKYALDKLLSQRFMEELKLSIN